MRVSRSDGLRCDFSANKLTICMSYMSFCNFNPKSDGRRYDFFHLITALPFPLQNLVQRLRSETPSSVSLTHNEVSAIPCELFGNTLRTLFLKNRDFFWYCEIFLPSTRGPLGCLLGFWPRRPKPCGGNNRIQTILSALPALEAFKNEVLRKQKLFFLSNCLRQLEHQLLTVFLLRTFILIIANKEKIFFSPKTPVASLIFLNVNVSAV